MTALVLDGLVHQTDILITKYESEAAHRAGQPYDHVIHHGNAFTPRGTRILWKLFSGQGAGNEFYSNSAARIFVGNSSNSVSGEGQPYNLQGGSASSAPIDAGFPTQNNVGTLVVAVNQIVYQATFGPTVAQFTWLEMGLVNGTSIVAPPALTDLPSSGTLFNRAIAPDVSLGWGTKVAGVVWVATIVMQVV